MERLTRRSESGMTWLIDHENNNIELEPCEMSSHNNRIAIEKLADYEDAEEHGMLLKVPPCRVGDIVYVVDRDTSIGGFSVFTGKWDVVSFRVLENGEIDVHGQVSYEIPNPYDDYKTTMPYCMYVGQAENKFGEAVFLTYEEAKRKLKELNK